MQAEPNAPQEQPAEGDRDMIDRELKRQDEKIAKENRKAMDGDKSGKA